MTYVKPTLRTGDLAYLDTFAGFIPCKVLSNSGASTEVATHLSNVTVRLTAARRDWRRGDVVNNTARAVVPRCAIRGMYSREPEILPYAVEADEELQSHCPVNAFEPAEPGAPG